MIKIKTKNKLPIETAVNQGNLFFKDACIVIPINSIHDGCTGFYSVDSEGNVEFLGKTLTDYQEISSIEISATLGGSSEQSDMDLKSFYYETDGWVWVRVPGTGTYAIGFGDRENGWNDLQSFPEIYTQLKDVEFILTLGKGPVDVTFNFSMGDMVEGVPYVCSQGYEYIRVGGKTYIEYTGSPIKVTKK